MTKPKHIHGPSARLGAGMPFDRFAWIRAVTSLNVSHGAAHLALALLNYLNRDGFAWPSRETLASDCRSTSRSVRRWLDELESLGLISRDFRSIRAEVPDVSGHWCPQPGHQCPDTSVRMGDTGVRQPDTSVRGGDTSVTHNRPIEQTNRTEKSSSNSFIGSNSVGESDAEKRAPSDYNFDGDVGEVMRVVAEVKGRPCTTEEAGELIEAATGRHDSPLQAVEDELRSVASRVRNASIPRLVAMVRDNLRGKEPKPKNSGGYVTPDLNDPIRLRQIAENEQWLRENDHIEW